MTFRRHGAKCAMWGSWRGGGARRSPTGPGGANGARTGVDLLRSERSDLFDIHPARCRKAETARVLWGAMALMPSSIALLFPGQGSHAEGMEEPYRGHPLMERGLELLGYNPFDGLAEGTRYQQPALFLCSVAAWDAGARSRRGRRRRGDRRGRPLARRVRALVAAGALGSTTPSSSSTSAPTPWPPPASSAPAA